jgi:uncharacterized protein YeaO (DUF488 family)
MISGGLPMDIQLKRIYDSADPEDGYRVLVDRIWPRGISKDKAKVDLWPKELAPSKELRQWFGHEPDKWPEFKRRYFKELRQQEENLQPLREASQKARVTLVFASKEERYNNAAALKAFLESETGE